MHIVSRVSASDPALCELAREHHPPARRDVDATPRQCERLNPALAIQILRHEERRPEAVVDWMPRRGIRASDVRAGIAREGAAFAVEQAKIVVPSVREKLLRGTMTVNDPELLHAVKRLVHRQRWDRCARRHRWWRRWRGWPGWRRGGRAQHSYIIDCNVLVSIVQQHSDAQIHRAALPLDLRPVSLSPCRERKAITYSVEVQVTGKAIVCPIASRTEPKHLLRCAAVDRSLDTHIVSFISTPRSTLSKLAREEQRLAR
mmetsp:Transcript_52079/g.153697  ORF Transcript_52079/g.153697 Transcript_52079/m.153697 type:complete len:259 (+) Transcript_52079:1711-2487(+)